MLRLVVLLFFPPSDAFCTPVLNSNGGEHPLPLPLLYYTPSCFYRHISISVLQPATPPICHISHYDSQQAV